MRLSVCVLEQGKGLRDFENCVKTPSQLISSASHIFFVDTQNELHFSSNLRPSSLECIDRDNGNKLKIQHLFSKNRSYNWKVFESEKNLLNSRNPEKSTRQRKIAVMSPKMIKNSLDFVLENE